MDISLDGIGKKYNKQWIFKNVSLELASGKSYVIKGKNGSGKSTLLKLITGIVSPSEGSLSYRKGDVSFSEDSLYNHISFCSPYQHLFPELSLEEQIKFHFRFKKYRDKNTVQEDLDLLGLRKKNRTLVRELSSGQVQRLKLLLAFNSDHLVLALDEPLSNLDSEGINWYKEKIKSTEQDRLLILASNNSNEFDFSHHEILISKYTKF